VLRSRHYSRNDRRGYEAIHRPTHERRQEAPLRSRTEPDIGRSNIGTYRRPAAAGRSPHTRPRRRRAQPHQAASSVDDRHKRQTFTATPAEPGDLPWGLGCFFRALVDSGDPLARRPGARRLGSGPGRVRGRRPAAWRAARARSAAARSRPGPARRGPRPGGGTLGHLRLRPPLGGWRGQGPAGSGAARSRAATSFLGIGGGVPPSRARGWGKRGNNGGIRLFFQGPGRFGRPPSPRLPRSALGGPLAAGRRPGRVCGRRRSEVAGIGVARGLGRQAIAGRRGSRGHRCLRRRGLAAAAAPMAPPQAGPSNHNRCRTCRDLAVWSPPFQYNFSSSRTGSTVTTISSSAARKMRAARLSRSFRKSRSGLPRAEAPQTVPRPPGTNRM
jgi:hypothetical protein